MKNAAIIIGACSTIGRVLIPKMKPLVQNLILTESKDSFPQLQELYENDSEMEQDRLRIFEMDAYDLKNIEDVFELIVKEDIDLRYCICTAGVNYLTSAIQVTEKIWDSVLTINLKSTFFIMQQAAKIMIMNQGGNIVNIASQHGIVANVDRAPYCASKAALINLTKALALEWAPYNIRVNTVSPTYIISEKNEELLRTSISKKQYLNSIPLKKYCEPEDVAHAILFLLSQDANIITGHNLIVDGGYTIR